MKNHHEFPSNHHEYPMKFHEIPLKSRVSWCYPWFFRTLRGAPRLRGVRPPSNGVGQDTPLPEERFGRRCFRGCSPNMSSMLDDVGYTRMLNKVFSQTTALFRAFHQFKSSSYAGALVSLCTRTGNAKEHKINQWICLSSTHILT